MTAQTPLAGEKPLADLIKYTIQWSDDTLSALFDNIDNQLFERAEKADNATDQNLYFDAMRLVRLHRKATHKEFISLIRQNFSIEAIKAEKTVQEKTSDSDGLSLVADDSLEQDLATQGMKTKAERDNKNNLDQLNKRLNYLYKISGTNISNENNPMGPALLCRSFAIAAGNLEADIKIRLLVFKLFDLNFVTKLHELYEHANQILIEHNILPQIKVSYKSAIKKQSSSNPTTGYSPDAEQADASTRIQQQQQFNNTDNTQTYTLIQQLLNQNKSILQLPPEQYASTDDLMDTFSQLQNNTEMTGSFNDLNDGKATSDLLKQALTQSLQSNQQKQAINQNDDNMIDVIGMLFDFILNDDNLVDSVKALLSRLQIPIIKTALQDQEFFRNKNHPARKLLNELANTGLGVTDNIDVQNNPLYLKLMNIVSKITDESTQNYNIDFFEELRENLQRFLAQFNHTSGRKKAPSKDAVLELVNTEISARIRKKELPNNIVLLLERIWRDVLFDIFVTDGLDSDEWDTAMTFVDTLMWSIDPKLDIQSQKQLVKVIPGILKALNTGLDRIDYPDDMREQLLQDLQNCHLACMKGQSVTNSQLAQDDIAYTSHKSSYKITTFSTHKSSKDLTAEEMENIDAGIDILLEGDLSNLDALDEDNLLASLEDGSEQAITDTDEAELIEDDYTQLARSLEAGDWVEFYGEEGKVYRAKISWRSEDADAYIFVTQTGQIAEKSLPGLSSALRNKQAVILDKSPVFERAMDAVLEDLQETTEH